MYIIYTRDVSKFPDYVLLDNRKVDSLTLAHFSFLFIVFFLSPCSHLSPVPISKKKKRLPLLACYSSGQNLTHLELNPQRYALTKCFIYLKIINRKVFKILVERRNSLVA